MSNLMLSKHYPIDSKKKFTGLYHQGVFGNASPTWGTYDEFISSSYGGLVHVRNKVAGGQTFYNLLRFEDISKACRSLGKEGYYISAMAPHTGHGTVQGEVCRSERHLDLTLTTGKLPMHEALLTDYTAILHGLHAESALQRWMDVNSYEWVQYLFDAYPDHVIEFSCFDRYWGTVPRRNTVIWEVRSY